MMNINVFWEKFIEKYPEYQSYTYTAWQFGVDATHLANLVIQGKKTATTSAYALYAIDAEPLPKVGDLSIVLNETNEPMCIIKTTRVEKVPYREVTALHAFLEGEGDRTLNYWKDAHEKFFKEEFQKYGLVFNEHELMICETFECLFH
ncbi:ASCH domain-containing protein [Staphylococcus chromogenes]|uniref:ASCH domain-containing protein n=1 Tax=Staphylococcus chromogenes TaxID=46126 RepID=UPI0030CA5366